jgi:hypothetical protein
MTWVLVHSPLVGPSTWRPLATLAAAGGIECVVPDLTTITKAEGFTWDRFVDSVASAVTGVGASLAIVGHSGAGALLPPIADRLGGVSVRMVFVDAVVPPLSGDHITPPGLLELLDERTDDGRLLNWFDWWPEETIATLVPDDRLLARMRSEAPRLPRAVYDQPIAMPTWWSSGRAGYVGLSEAYADEVEEAKSRGWPVVETASNHLGMATEPRVVLEAINTVIEDI